VERSNRLPFGLCANPWILLHSLRVLKAHTQHTSKQPTVPGFYSADRVLSYNGHFLCAGAAGSLSAGITNPLDVVKTRLQTQNLKSSFEWLSTRSQEDSSVSRYLNIKSSVKIIYSQEGIPGLFRGVVPRMVFFVPGAAVSWSTYEFVKDFLLNSESLL